MVIFLIGIAVSLIMFAALGFDERGRNWSINPRQMGAAVALAITLGVSMVTLVPTGYTGILTSFGKVEDRTIQAGLNITAPWQKVVKMDNRAQKETIETAAFSSDIQQVDVVVTLNYKINENTAMTLYKTVGKKYYDTIVFFCHPYSAYERGSNENMNRIIRRFFPKGTNFDDVTKEQIEEAEKWINHYPRKILGWRSAADLFQKELQAA